MRESVKFSFLFYLLKFFCGLLNFYGFYLGIQSTLRFFKEPLYVVHVKSLTRCGHHFLYQFRPGAYRELAVFPPPVLLCVAGYEHNWAVDRAGLFQYFVPNYKITELPGSPLFCILVSRRDLLLVAFWPVLINAGQSFIVQLFTHLAIK